MSRLKNSGFTLLEVLIAVTILSVGLVMVVRSFATSLRAIQVAHNFLTANLLLEEQIWQKQEQQSRRKISAEDESDEYAEPFGSFSYRTTFVEAEDLTLLYKTEFSVSWQQRNSKWATSSVTYFLGQQQK